MESALLSSSATHSVLTTGKAFRASTKGFALTSLLPTILLLIGLVTLSNTQASAQSAGEFRSRATGNWEAFATWERYNGLAWLPATIGQVPTVNSKVTLRSPYTVTLNTTYTEASQVFQNAILVKSGATLVLAANLTTTNTITIEQGGTIKDLYQPTTNPTGFQATLKIGTQNQGPDDRGLTVSGELNISYVTVQKSTNTINSTGNVTIKRDFTSTNNGDMVVGGPVNVKGNWSLQNGNTQVASSNNSMAGYITVEGCLDMSGGGNINNVNVGFCVQKVGPNGGCASRAVLESNANSCVFTTLPIRLVSFTAQVEAASNRVKLSWVTSSQKDNALFTLERSENGLNFVEVGSTPGAGNSNERLSYTHYDAAPLSGTSYYRLRQTDLDGASTTSKLVAVYNEAMPTTEETWSLFPNPSTGNGFSVRTTGITEPLEVSIYNQFGKKLYEHAYQLNGEVSLQVTMPETLASGMYVVRIQQGQSLTVTKLKVTHL